MQETRSTVNLVGALAGLAAVAALAVANFGGAGSNGGAAPFAVLAVLSLAVAGVLFWWYIPRASRPAAAGLVVGAIGLLAVAAFWTGLPYVLGPAGALLGIRALRTGGGSTATAAIVVGTLAFVLGIAALVYDQIAT